MNIRRAVRNLVGPFRGWASSDGNGPSGGRGQSETLGVVMLFGLVGIGAVSLLVVGGSVVSETEATAEQERIEQSFVQLSHAMATVSSDGEMPDVITFEAGDSGAITKTDAGTITIEGGNVSQKLNVGAVEYEHDDGSIVAYQAGGVWAERGNETRMISAPPISYDAAEETLILPVTDMDEGKDLHSGIVSIALSKTDPVRAASRVEDDTVEITIESPYYRGWEAYFRTQAGDASIRDVDHANERVLIELGHHDLDGAFDTGIKYSDEFERHNEEQFDNEAEQGNMPAMDSVITDMVNETKNEPAEATQLGTVTTSTTITNGTYYADGIELGNGDTFVVDLQDGNGTLVVDGDIRLTHNDAEFVVRNWEQPDGDRELLIYATGDFLMEGGAMYPETQSDVDAGQLQLYGTAEMSAGFKDGYFQGVLYAAGSDWEAPNAVITQNDCDEYQVCFLSNPEFDGSVVAQSVNIHASAGDYNHDPDLAGQRFSGVPENYILPPQLTYLNVAIFEMNVENR